MEDLWDECVAQLVAFCQKDPDDITVGEIESTSQHIKAIRNGHTGGDKVQETARLMMRVGVVKLIADYMRVLNSVWNIVVSSTGKKGYRTALVILKSRLYAVLSSATTLSREDLHARLVADEIPLLVAKDLAILRELYEKTKGRAEGTMAEALSNIIMHGFAIIDNCARGTALLPQLKEQVMKEIYFFADPQDNFPDHVLSSVSIIERVHPDNDLHTQFFSETFLTNVAKMLGSLHYHNRRGRHVVKYPEVDFYMELGTYLICLVVFAKQEDYRCYLIEELQHNEATIDATLSNGSQVEKERMKNLLKLLVEHECDKCSCNFLLILLPKYDIRPDGAPPERRPVPPLPDPAPSPGTFGQVLLRPEAATADGDTYKCKYMQMCHAFLQELQIKDVYLDKAHHRCFCDPCFNGRGDVDIYTRGQPPMDYALPRGWVKFALRPGARATAMDIWSSWHVAFHGTRSDCMAKILETGDLLMPDDRKPDGERLAPPSGHFTHGRKPTGFNINQVFLSPSICYSGKPVYAPQQSFTEPKSKKTMYGRVAFQVRIKPGSYSVGPETVGAGATPIDSHFSNKELEWSTDYRGVVILVGIIIRVEKNKDPK